MKNMYGLLSLGGFMITMLCYVIARVEVTKPELVVTFLTWIGIELILFGIRKLVAHFFRHEKRARIDTLAHSRD